MSESNTGVYLRQLYDSLVTNLHQELALQGYAEITPSHGLIFQYLDEKGSRITSLASLAGMTKQSMSALVYQLENLGYLNRTPDPDDGRAALFILTPKGEQLKKIAQKINRSFEQRWEEAVGVENYSLLRELLLKMIESGS
ncbi:DNA-binding transcriptional regulator, MarR family [Dyadobacter sp. SG02]|uniref:MarR family winged helix-turn-helix transcriptional regulator n=1 Tax=Dyadobacter sp. SG02 TaxID=1855291 RepID=UPI0008C87F45|nr:MarR family transcriptional regulator [Dyadobacter sp. SG02]SEI84189.1 DNA-binding transcriptional regulator, MarR family [Dyadobacter sp. SG02]